MKPTQTLMDEHRVIERMMDIVEAAAARLEWGESVPPNVFADVGLFFSRFADKCHHGKEEANLFPVMVRRGIPQEGGPVGVMLAEHVQGRGYVRAIRDLGAQYADGKLSDTRPLIQAVRSYVGLLRPRIQKEDRILYRMADQMMTEQDQRDLSEAFDRVEREEMGDGEHERYHTMIEQLEGALQK